MKKDNLKPLNRLLIFGNGFDISLGHPTKFENFIDWLELDLIKRILLNEEFKNPLIRLTFETNLVKQRLIEELEKLQGRIVGVEIDERTNTIKNFSKEFEGHLIVKGGIYIERQKFLRSCVENIKEKGWVDLEGEYERKLESYALGDIPRTLGKKTIIKDFVSDKWIHLDRTNYRQEMVSLLNKEWAYLKDKLKEYIEIVNRVNRYLKKDSIISAMENKSQFNTFCKKKGYEPSFFSEENRQDVQGLTFNYTNFVLAHLEEVFDDNSKYSFTMNFIHGYYNGDIIFGFGDEGSEKYLELENSSIDGVTNYIKSFQYLKNENYHKLLNFLEKKDFFVEIFGHSCGASDRTLLRTIFNHPSCKFILPHYYNEKDYNSRVLEIARCFSDKVSFREKMVPFNICQKF